MRKHLLFILLACAINSGCADDKKPAQNTSQQKTPALQESIHSSFSITQDILSQLVAGGILLPDMQQKILAQPKEFLDLMNRLMQEPQGLLVLVDKKNQLPEGWEPQDLVNLRDYPISLSRNNLQLRSIVMPDLLRMAESAKADGITLLLSSTYRSAAYQKTVYERIVKEMGQEAADRESARPRHSQHQLGTVVDFGSIDDNFTGTKMERWLDANAWKYGFSLSFPEGMEERTGYRFESWHFRYIGIPAAEMANKYFDSIQQIMLEFLHAHGKNFAELYTGS